MAVFNTIEELIEILDENPQWIEALANRHDQTGPWHCLRHGIPVDKEPEHAPSSSHDQWGHIGH